MREMIFIAAALYGVMHAAIAAEPAASAWHAVFPQAEPPRGAVDRNLEAFVALARQNLGLLSEIGPHRSLAARVIQLPDKLHPGLDPAFLYEQQLLLIGPLAGCAAMDAEGYAAVNLHEYAHTVFFANLDRALIASSKAEHGSGYDARAAFAGKRESELAKPVSIRDLVSPLEEVFADAFAVFSLDDPQALSKALRACGRSGSRDFSAHYPAEGWQGGELRPLYLPRPTSNPYDPPLPSDTPAGYLFGPDVHEILSPVRSEVWSMYLAWRARGVRDPARAMMTALQCAAHGIARRQHDAGMTYRDWFALPKPGYNIEVIGLLHECAEAGKG